IVVGKVSFVAASLLNDLLVGFLAALMVVYLRWRTIVAIVIGVPIALLAGMIGVAMLLEQRLAAGWRDIAPRPVATGPYGKWDPIATAFTPAVNGYLAKEVARADDVIDPLPQDVDHFFVAHRSQIDALRQHPPENSD